MIFHETSSPILWCTHTNILFVHIITYLCQSYALSYSSTLLNQFLPLIAQTTLFSKRSTYSCSFTVTLFIVLRTAHFVYHQFPEWSVVCCAVLVVAVLLTFVEIFMLMFLSSSNFITLYHIQMLYIHVCVCECA